MLPDTNPKFFFAPFHPLAATCALHQLYVILNILFLSSSALPNSFWHSNKHFQIWDCCLPVLDMIGLNYTVPSLLPQSVKSSSLLFFLHLLLRFFSFIFRLNCLPNIHFPLNSAITPQRLKQWWSTLCALCTYKLNCLHWKFWLQRTCWIWSLACFSEF